MPETTIAIDREQREGLYELVRNHLGAVEDLWVALERARDFARAERLARELVEDFWLLDDIGWAEREEREEFELTMPPYDLMELLRRLRGEAGPVLEGGEADPEGDHGRRAVPERPRRLRADPRRARPRGGSRLRARGLLAPGARAVSGTEPALIEVARAAAAAWSQSNISNAEGGIGLGVLAALLLMARQDPEGGDPGPRLLTAADEEIAQILERAWCRFGASRPELAFRCGPFGEWLDEEPRDQSKVAAAAAVARAAIEAGIMEFVLDPDRTQRVDVLGHCNHLLQDKGALRSHGQYNTPAPVAEAMAAMALRALTEGRSVIDSFAGTGGLLRAAAAELREAGEDPHAFCWNGCDIDPVLAAALAVNCHVWDLGPRVLLGCADAIAEPGWQVRAAAEQRRAIEIREGLAAGARLLAVARAVQDPDRGGS